METYVFQRFFGPVISYTDPTYKEWKQREADYRNTSKIRTRILPTRNGNLGRRKWPRVRRNRTRILPTRNGNLFSNLNSPNPVPTHGSYLQGMETRVCGQVCWERGRHTDPTYKEWKQNYSLPPRPLLEEHGSYLQGMETIFGVL